MKPTPRRKPRQQDDRLLKQLSRLERRHQEQIRAKIAKDLQFVSI